MKVKVVKGITFSVITELNPPYDRPRLQQSKYVNDILAKDITTNDIVLLTDYPGNYIMSCQDILNELDYIKHSKFSDEKLRVELTSYYIEVLNIIRSHKRDIKIEEVLEWK